MNKQFFGIFLVALCIFLNLSYISCADEPVVSHQGGAGGGSRRERSGSARRVNPGIGASVFGEEEDEDVVLLEPEVGIDHNILSVDIPEGSVIVSNNTNFDLLFKITALIGSKGGEVVFEQVVRSGCKGQPLYANSRDISNLGYTILRDQGVSARIKGLNLIYVSRDLRVDRVNFVTINTESEALKEYVSEAATTAGGLLVPSGVANAARVAQEQVGGFAERGAIGAAVADKIKALAGVATEFVASGVAPFSYQVYHQKEASLDYDLASVKSVFCLPESRGFLNVFSGEIAIEKYANDPKNARYILGLRGYGSDLSEVLLERSSIDMASEYLISLWSSAIERLDSGTKKAVFADSVLSLIRLATETCMGVLESKEARNAEVVAQSEQLARAKEQELEEEPVVVEEVVEELVEEPIVSAT